MSEGTKPGQERRRFRAIKGVRDILPPATDLWNWFEKTARSVMEAYNFHEIRLPIFEETELFARSIGEDTDVVSKEMFTWDESGTPVESELEKHWIRKHLAEFSRDRDPVFGTRPVFANRSEYDLVVGSAEGITVVEFKRKTINRATVENIREHRKVLREEFPNERSTKFLI